MASANTSTLHFFGNNMEIVEFVNGLVLCLQKDCVWTITIGRGKSEDFCALTATVASLEGSPIQSYLERRQPI